MKQYILGVLLVLASSYLCAQKDTNAYVLVLGVAQDGGYPHAGCMRKCCTKAWANDNRHRYVVSLALVAPNSKKWWLFEATPDITAQLHYFRELTGGRYNYLPDGIFITHAHIGHYAGLMQLGREVMNTKNVPVYVLPRMKSFLEANGPWSQLVQLKNIELKAMNPEGVGSANSSIFLEDGHATISVSAFTVPHRDEYSETAGFRIVTNAKKYLFIPDVDKWERWDKHITDEVATVDVALLDATFYQDGEIPGRSISEVPHPFVSETMKLFQSHTAIKNPSFEMSKIHFIHFNHTNPLMWDKHKQAEVKRAGFHIAEQGQKL